MSNIVTVLHWLGALVVATIVYSIVFALGAVIWQHSEAERGSALHWIVTLATMLGVVAGTFIVPRAKWQAAALVLWAIALLGPIWGLVQDALAGRFGLANFVALGGTLLGGGIAFYSVRVTRSARKINRVAEQKRQ